MRNNPMFGLPNTTGRFVRASQHEALSRMRVNETNGTDINECDERIARAAFWILVVLTL
jgi:hypothetical protein